MTSRRWLVSVALLAALLRPIAASGQAPSCSVLGQNLAVRQTMSDVYLWRHMMPRADPTIYPSPERYLDALRYRPLDQSFSYITTRAANDALFQRGEFVGFGFSSIWVEETLRVSQVFPGSPAFEFGLRRGDRIVEIDGRRVEELREAGLESALGPAVAGVAVSLAVEREGRVLSGPMTKRPVTIPSVSDARVFDVGGRRVGYLFFRNFVEPSVSALDAAFRDFRDRGVNELVLDLRYNAGGLVPVAQHLAGLIGGPYTGGQVFARYQHNDRNPFRDRVLRFPVPAQHLGLRRLFVITSRVSASASELLINALRPFIPVAIIGERTFGKPVGQYSVPFCDKVLVPVSFMLRNASGDGEFFSGLEPTCTADDDLGRAIGASEEASLAEALHAIATGQCSGRSGQRVLQRLRTPAAPWGFAQVVAAH